MKVLVTGIQGQLGHDVMKELSKRGHDAIGVDLKEMDITQEQQVITTITNAQVDAVIHCAAYTAVEAAEEQEELCTRVNVDGTRYIAKACKTLDLKMVYVSTDYVFDGKGTKPWEVEDEPNPINVYGKTKYEGEVVVRELLQKYFIVRVSWVFGKNGNNFIKKMLQLGKEKGEVSVVNDQIGSPTYTFDLARLLVDMVETEKYGLYHATNEEECSWYEFASEIFNLANIKVNLHPVSSNTFPVKATRPLNSRLSKASLTKAGFEKLPTWKNALARYLDELGYAVNH